MGTMLRSTASRKPTDKIRVIVTATFMGLVFGFLIGASFPKFPLAWLNISAIRVLPIEDLSHVEGHSNGSGINNTHTIQSFNSTSISDHDHMDSSKARNMNGTSKIWVPSNPRGAETLPKGIVVAESDFYLRRLWGNPKEDLITKPKYLVTFTVGYNLRYNVDKAVKKFSGNFTILLFHYDARVNEWDEFQWSKQAIHVSVHKQTKWWYAKRFLHPDIIAPYDYIFIWDEDLGVEHFDAEEYIKLVRKHDLEISQPGLESKKVVSWQMTMKRDGQEVHKTAKEKSGWCADPHQPPCAAFVEIMAPVFSRDAWRCVWHLIQNDLVHGWGLDFALRTCVEPAHEKIGVVDAQWIVHQSVPSLGNQGETQNGKAPWLGDLVAGEGKV